MFIEETHDPFDFLQNIFLVLDRCRNNSIFHSTAIHLGAYQDNYKNDVFMNDVFHWKRLCSSVIFWSIGFVMFGIRVLCLKRKYITIVFGSVHLDHNNGT